MSSMARRRINQELDLIDRFGRTYRERFAHLIRELNARPTEQTAHESLRLCVETLDMLLSAQASLSTVLRELASPPKLHLAA